MILLDGEPIQFDSYPNGETLIQAPRSVPWFTHRDNELTLKYESDADLIHLMFLQRHMTGPIVLRIRYMPYSRMDRVQNDTDVFTLRYVADFINSLNFPKIIVEEPHSDVTCALLNNAVAEYPTVDLLPDVTHDIGWHLGRDYLFFPDAGAQKRYAGVLGYKSAVGFKHRDFSTGRLSGEMDVLGFDTSDMPPKVLILDDLCSRGGTFVMASMKLRSMGAALVYLFVAHCEEAVWEGNLLEHIDGLYCTDSILSHNLPHPKVHVYSEGKWQ